MHTTLTHVVVAACAWAAACSESRDAREARFQITVTDDAQQALAGIPVVIDDQPVANTDEQGQASLTFEAQAHRAKVSIQCAEGYTSPEPRSVALAPHGRQPVLSLAFRCTPSQRSLLLVVRSPEATGFPVLVDGEQVGLVEADGTLHAVIRRSPGTSLRISLDTSSAPRLIPQNPVREIRVVDQDDIIVFDQPLTVVGPRARKRLLVSRPDPAERRHIPYAIGSGRF